MDHEINRYYARFRKLLQEDMTAGMGGVFGDGIPIDQVNPGDSYAPGDARNIFSLGVTSRKGRVNKRRRKKRKK